MSNQDMHDPVPEEQGITEPLVGTGTPQVDLKAVKLTDVGRVRSHNEDYVDSYVPTDPAQLERKGAIYLVADGMGGHQAGEVASKGAVELVIRQYYAAKESITAKPPFPKGDSQSVGRRSDPAHDVGTSLVRAFRAANKLIYEQARADASKAGMGTTLVAAVVRGRKVYLANVGDSRAYLINDAGIAQITEDHSWVEEQVRAGLLTTEQSIRHPQRNLLTRALGTKPDVEVDLFEGELGEGDVLLMCSDGLTGRVEDAEIAAVVHEHHPQEAARLLVALANERGGNDNITVLIVSDQHGVPTLATPVAASGVPAVAATPQKERHFTAPVPIKKQPTRKFPLVPVLVAAAGMLVLLLGGLLLVPLLTGREPTPTPTAIPPLATASESPQAEPTVTVAVTQPGVEPTSPISEGPSPEPTTTLMATFTPAPPTLTPRPTTSLPTATSASPSATPESQDPPPTLNGPAADSVLQGEVAFVWDYTPMPLGLGKAFQVLIWREGDVQHNGAAEFTRMRGQRIDIDEVPQIKSGGVGTYYWTVVVADRRSEQRLSPEAEARRFTYPGPLEPGGGSDKPAGKASPTPRP